MSGAVLNVHARLLPVDRAAAGRLIDSLASGEDRLWPDRWPRIRLDGSLAIGARGGHGPIRYGVEGYEPGQSVTFRFTRPVGFDGTHGYVVEPDGGGCRLVHRLEMRATGWARISWPLVYRPLHDALMEDSLDRAERELGTGPGGAARWSPRVRLLRRLLRPRRGGRSGARTVRGTSIPPEDGKHI